ncbi:MAG: ATP-binding protein [Firmicutes bacterium]|nr:ATP-binding protein [Bacillota bacterium]
MLNYRGRITDEILKRKLKGIGAVLIEGPKLCGKTTTAEQAAKSILYMADPDDRAQNLQMAQLKPSLLLEGQTPRLIDEWQIAPTIWDAVRFEVDHRNENGQFILTGSAVPADRSKLFHSGTGRFAWVKMRTMSLYESGDSSGDVSLKSLFEQKSDVVGINSSDEIEKIAYLACRGGWPTTLELEEDISLDRAYDYYDAIVNVDISRVDEVKRNSERAKRLMRAYARSIGTQISYATLQNDISANDSDTLNVNTVMSYVHALQKIFIIEDMPAWNPNIRSKTAIRTSDTRYFTDPSIAVAALGLGPKDLIKDLKTFGFVFENLCVRDLRVYADALGGQVYHYRDKSGLECDAVIHLKDGKYALIEIKLGGEENIEYGAKTLIQLKNKIDYDKMPVPSFMMVLTGKGKYAYKREDDVYVVPLGALKN